MLQDVSPGGQYALFNADGSAADHGYNVLYNNWRTVFPVRSSSDPAYSASEITLPNGTVMSPYDASFTLPQLVTYWKPDWANSFLPFHPEYCKYIFCVNNVNYEIWDEQVQSISKASGIAAIVGAPSGQQYVEGQTDWLLTIDPFFKTGAPGAGVAAAFQRDLQNYSVSVLNLTTVSGKTLEQVIDYVLYCANPAASTNTSIDPNSPNFGTMSARPAPACRSLDKEWALYQQFYFQLKQKCDYDQVRANTNSPAPVPAR